MNHLAKSTPIRINTKTEKRLLHTLLRLAQTNLGMVRKKSDSLLGVSHRWTRGKKNARGGKEKKEKNQRGKKRGEEILVK